MRVRRIVVRRAPGLPAGVRAEGLGPRLSVILGPNASGKSTLARTLLGALWPEAAPPGLLGEVEVETSGGTAAATLRWGTVVWSPGPPPLPGPESRALARLDLPALLASGEAEDRLAHRIAVELAGGYDLESALAEVAVPSPRRGELQARLEQARRAVRSAEVKLEHLAEDEARLPALEQDLAQAKAAQELVRLAHGAMELATLRHELAEVEARLPALPEGLDRLAGDEDERLAQIRERLHEAEEDMARLEAGHRETAAELARLRFPKGPPAREVLAAWVGRARWLEERAREAELLRRRAAAAREEATRAARGLFREPERPLALEGERLEALERALDQLHRAQAALQAREIELRIWEGYAGETDPAAIPRLERAADTLRGWLTHRRPPIPRIAGWLALGAGAVLAAVSAVLPWPPAALAAGTGLLGAGLAWLLAARGTGGAGRNLPEDLAPPTWTDEAVRDTLDRIEERLASARLAREAARRARETAELVEEERHRSQHTFAVPVTAAAEELGLDPELPFLPLMDQARRLERWHGAEAQRVRTDSELRVLEEEIRAALDEFDGWLTAIGCEPVRDAAGAAAAVAAVEDRLTRLDAAERSQRGLEEELERARERARRNRAELAELWERVGVAAGDEAELARRLEALPRWRDLTGRRAALTARIAPLEEELEGHWEALGLDPRRLTHEAAQARRRELASAAERVEELVREITDIRSALDRASGGHRLEAARAELDEAALAVAGRRDEAMAAALTRLVLERARDTVAREHAPAVLERARRWFARFTRGAFQLEVDAGGRLHAVDTAEDARRGLEQLSDGTRIHLLLAARLAALEEAEGTTGPLPLVLDEALSTTDPGRFREIARALAEATGEGRQILYLTADPTEAEHWREAFAEAGLDEPAVVELASAAGSRTWGPPEPIPEPPTPAPGEDAAAYAGRLGLSPPDPFAEVTAWPVLWLLPDRLEAVHRLLAAGVVRLGAWRELAQRGAEFLDPPDAALLAARASLAGAALEAWRVGRGRPVTWADVAAGGAVSGRFEPAVRELLEQHGHDPGAFLHHVRDLKGFRSAKAEQLEEHLLALGVLDRRAPLPEDAVVARALVAAEPALERAGIHRAEAARWLRGLLRALSA